MALEERFNTELNGPSKRPKLADKSEKPDSFPKSTTSKSGLTNGMYGNKNNPKVPDRKENIPKNTDVENRVSTGLTRPTNGPKLADKTKDALDTQRAWYWNPFTKR